MFGTIYELGPKHVGRKAGAAAIGNYQSCYAGHVRASHGGTAVIAVTVAGERAIDIGSRSADVYPVSEVGEGGTMSAAVYGSHGQNGLIIGRSTILDVVVTGCKNDNSALHRGIFLLVTGSITAGIFDEIIHGCLGSGVDAHTFCALQFVGRNTAILVDIHHVAPAVLRDDCTMVGTPADSIGSRAIAFGPKELTGHDFYAGPIGGIVTTGNAAGTFAVIVHGGDGSCHMRTMTHRLYIVASVCKVTAAIVSSRNTVPGQILMFQVHTLVHNGDNNCRVTRGVFLPHRKAIDIRTGRTAVDIMPLGAESRVVENGVVQENLRLRLGGNNAGQGREVHAGLGNRCLGRVILHKVEVSQTGGALPFTELNGALVLREYRIHGSNAQIAQAFRQIDRLGGSLIRKTDQDDAGLITGLFRKWSFFFQNHLLLRFALAGSGSNQCQGKE